MDDIIEREKRFEGIMSEYNTPNGLLKVGTMSKEIMEGLQNAVLSYLKRSIGVTTVTTLKDLGFLLDEGWHCDNMTPNGLMVPKSYNMLEYNRVVASIYEVIHSAGIDTDLKDITVTPNVRFKNRSRINDEAKHATEHPHSDCWSGVPSTNATMHIPIAGDIARNKLHFYYPNNDFKHNWLAPIESYESGQQYINRAKKIDVNYKEGEWVLFDSALFHQTVREDHCGWRISIDLQCTPHGELTEITGDTERNRNMVSLETLSEIGTKQILVFEDGYGVRRNNTFTHSANVRIVKL